ncbi:MAG: ABC transporter permease [Candidatus Brocadiae bacterium]|nr:ABC transporter permease [Candidatus Brocadiia bacterium]
MQDDTTRRQQKIGKQIVLPLSKAFEIAWKGIKIRLWRSVITMSGIVLAIAFLMSVWTSSVFDRSLRSVEPSDELYGLVQDVLEAEAIASGRQRIQCAIVEQERAATSVEHVTPGMRIRHFLDGEEAFRSLPVPADADAIAETLEGENPPHVMLLAGFPDVVSVEPVPRLIGDFVRGGGLLVAYGAEGLQDRPAPEQMPLARLLPASPGSGSFSAEGADIEPGQEFAQVLWQNHPGAAFLETSGKPKARALASSGGRPLGWMWQVGDGTVAWYAVDASSAQDVDVISWLLRGQTTQAAGEKERETTGLLVRLIARAVGKKVETGDMRGTWLVTLSLLVCVVGISNAMLMSVTERFREIGTMKCLGALDMFVVKLFLIESSLQGVVGSVAGALIGFSLSFVRALFTFHVKDVQTGEGFWLSLRYFPAATLLGWVGVALGTGIVLSVIAAIYPAIRAARMEPVQAMRAEA